MTLCINKSKTLPMSSTIHIFTVPYPDALSFPPTPCTYTFLHCLISPTKHSACFHILLEVHVSIAAI